MTAFRPLAVGLGVVALGGLAVSLGAMFLEESQGFMPHGHCYLWRPGLVALHLTSDSLIGVAYVVIALTLAYLVYRARSGLPFHWMVLAFGTFIIACGVTHFMEVWTLWWPDYWLSGNVKVVTAIASVATALALPPLVPRALQLIDADRVSEERRVQLDERTRLLEAAKAAHAEAETARAEAEAANRTKDQFLAVVSHELRTPLSPILAWARMLRQPELKSNLEQGLASIERAARTQAQIVEDLLDVSRIVSGKLRLDVRPIELEPVIEAALEAVRPAADAKEIRLLSTLDPRAGFVSGDPDRLQQVFWNLLSNAIKFTGKGGRVHVHLERVNSHLEVTVTDTGYGIPPEKLPHLFERFWQAETGPTRAHGGLGLGLAIVRHLVELHGGTVAAHSEGPERGSVFHVMLPIRAITPDLGAPTREHPAAWKAPPLVDGPLLRLDGVRLLVVDDDPETTATLDLLLSAQGAEVKTASSAEGALAILEGWLPQVLIADIGMPVQDGYAFLEQLRRRPRGQGGRVPAIALTAYARVDDRVRILASGFEMHVTKPVEPSELLAVIATVARRAYG